MDESSAAVGPSRLGIAEAILEAVPVAVVRKEVRLRRSWASEVYSGFRADSLTRVMVVRGAPRFAASIPLLGQLCTVYLDSIGAAPSSLLSKRLGDAATQSEEIADRLRVLLTELDGRALEQLPLRLDPVSEHSERTTKTSLPAEEARIQPSVAKNRANALPGAIAPATDDLQTPDGLSAEQAVPEFLRDRVFLIWEPPDDDVEEAQKAVTLFGRSLVEFVGRQLRGAYGDAWLRRGCPKGVRDALKEKANAQGGRLAVPPASLLGYAELGQLFDIIVEGNNWRYFAPYFGTREYVARRVPEITGLRVSAMHPEERNIDFLANVAGFNAMARIAEAYDPITAKTISDLCQSIVADPEESADAPILVGERIFTNLATLRDPQLSGRESEVKELERFWRDPFERVMSVSGAGGVGKTALTYQFLFNLLQQPCPAGKDPDPHGLVYLTAKNNYLRGFHVPDPALVRFAGLREVLDSTISRVRKNG